MTYVTSRAPVFLMIIFCLVSTLYSPDNLTAGNKKTVAYVMKALSNPFWIKVDQGARKYAQEHEISLEMFGVGRETDVEHQISIIDNLISRGYGAIVVAPSDSKRLIPVCVKALEKGVKIINVDNPLDKKILAQMGVTIPFIGPDNFAGGEMIGNYVRSKLKGKGKILVIEGMPGVSNSDNRKNGYLRGVTQNSSVELVGVVRGNWHRDEAFAAAVKAFEEYGQVDAVFCANDVMSLGVLQALDMFGLAGQVILTGYDNIDLVKTEMLDGRIHATVEQHPESMGSYGVKAAWDSLNGEPVPNEQNTPLELITSDHMGKKIVFSVSNLKNQFFSTMAASAKKEAIHLGMGVTVLDSENQEAKQIVEIFSALESKTDLLILNPTNSVISPVLDRVEEMNIPIITVDRQLLNATVLSHVASNNREGGQLVAKFIADHLEEKGDILELEGIPGTSAAHNRGAGFNEELMKYPNITIAAREVADFDRQRAKSVVARLINEGLRVDGVFAHNDYMILGFIDAYEEAGVELPRILVGFDGIETARQYIRDGKLTATIAQQPDIMGKLVMQTAAQYFRGDEVPGKIDVELQLIEE